MVKNPLSISNNRPVRFPVLDSVTTNYLIFLITDESMMIGSEKLLLTLGVEATKPDEQPLGHQHVPNFGGHRKRKYFHPY